MDKLQRMIIKDKDLGKGYSKTPAFYTCQFCNRDYNSLKDIVRHQKECQERKKALEFEQSKGKESRYIIGFGIHDK